MANKNTKPAPEAEKDQEVPQKSAASRKPFKLTATHILWVVGILALLIGGIGMYQRFTEGLRLTALGSFVPWGLWVATYEYFVWLDYTADWVDELGPEAFIEIHASCNGEVWHTQTGEERAALISTYPL